jgi:hypothetical protein
MKNTQNNSKYFTSVLKSLEIKDPDIYQQIINFKKMINLDKFVGDRYSSSLLLDLFFAFENSTINIDEVIHEIKFLEGINSDSKTKVATQFKRLPLKGLWHKHYTDSSRAGMVKNVQNAFKNYSIPFFEKKNKEAKKTGEKPYITVEDIPKLVNEIVTGNLQRRSAQQKMTGEWIVYAINEDVNYYLCVGKHGEDERIRNIIDCSCTHEFPFLKEILQKSK